MREFDDGDGGTRSPPDGRTGGGSPVKPGFRFRRRNGTWTEEAPVTRPPSRDGGLEVDTSPDSRTTAEAVFLNIIGGQGDLPDRQGGRAGSPALCPDHLSGVASHP